MGNYKPISPSQFVKELRGQRVVKAYHMKTAQVEQLTLEFSGGDTCLWVLMKDNSLLYFWRPEEKFEGETEIGKEKLAN